MIKGIPAYINKEGFNAGVSIDEPYDGWEEHYNKGVALTYAELEQIAQHAFEAGREEYWSSWGKHPLPDQALWVKKYDDFQDYWQTKNLTDKGEG